MNHELYNTVVNYGSIYHFLKTYDNLPDFYNYLLESKSEINLKIYDLCNSSTTLQIAEQLDSYILIKAHLTTIDNISSDLIIKELLPPEISETFIYKLLKYFSIIYTTKYWNYLKNLYYDYILKFNLINYSVKINQLFRKYFLANLKDFSESEKTLKKLALLSNEKIAYYLGYNIKTYIPTTEILLQQLSLTIDFSVVKKNNKEFIINLTKLYNKKIINNLDDNNEYINSYYEEIINYNLYDVYYFIYDNFIYLYTVDEIATLIKNKKHFCNRINLNEIHLEILKNHQYIGEKTLEYNLTLLK